MHDEVNLKIERKNWNIARFVDVVSHSLISSSMPRCESVRKGFRLHCKIYVKEWQ